MLLLTSSSMIWKVKEKKPVLFLTKACKPLNVPMHSFVILNSCG